MLAQRSSIILSCESVCSGVNKAMRYLTRGCLQNGGPLRNLNPCWPHVNGTLSKNYLPRNPFRHPLGDPPGHPLVLACSGFSASRGSIFSESSFTVKGFRRKARARLPSPATPLPPGKPGSQPFLGRLATKEARPGFPERAV